MPTLTWGGKEKVVNHHHDVPLRTLKHKYTFKAPEGTPDNSIGNKIIHGDNLEALKALLPEFEGHIKCIYIDPPYNTGNENWIYNDNVNDPKIKKWLGQVVGKEGEDLSRHDKWLCMMYPRLKLLHRLLANDGTLFVSIDDTEGHYLKAVLDEIFGRTNFISNVLWQKRTSPDARVQLGAAHDHILVYAKKIEVVRLNRLKLSTEQTANFKNPDNDPRGAWASTDFTAQGYRPNQMYTITTPSGAKYEPPPGRCWGNIEPVFLKLCAEGRIWFGKNGASRPRVKTYLSETDGLSSWTWWTNSEVGHNQESKKEVNQLLGASNSFDTPKPERLIHRILSIATDHNSIILDSFAGSGTTAHAVLKLNQQDGGNRRFILIETEDYAETITAERVRRVMSGYGENSKSVAGTGGQFDFYEMGESIFTGDSSLNTHLSVNELRRYIGFTENIPAASQIGTDDPRSPYLLGMVDDTAYFFCYEPEKTTTLDLEFLGALSFKPSSLIIYADNCLLDDAFLQRHNIIYKKISRDVMRY
jgi:adenine-specific DNA-methyltransferase